MIESPCSNQQIPRKKAVILANSPNPAGIQVCANSIFAHLNANLYNFPSTELIGKNFLKGITV